MWSPHNQDPLDFTRVVAATKLNNATPIGYWEMERTIGHRFDRGGAHGLHGWEGPKGQTGSVGVSGAGGVTAGASGSPGHPGEPGLLGLHGNNGQNGQNGSEVLLTLTGVVMDPNNLTLEVTDRGKSKSLCSFSSANQFILLRAAGGNAGDGGIGGPGGSGGSGATGRHGGNTAATCNGGPGGNGGRGGAGGRGGQGGQGGNGGAGGHAAQVTVTFVDPTTLMALEIDVEGGRGGRAGGPGAAGVGGSGGPGGSGGSGGSPGSYTTTVTTRVRDANGNYRSQTRTVTRTGSRGPSGRPGSSGQHGPQGTLGTAGVSGPSGQRGSTLFMWKDAAGKVVETGSAGYNLRLISLEVVDSLGDGVFQPLEELTITNVTIMNDGDMTAPAGALFEIVSSLEITALEPTTTSLPSLPPGCSMTLPQTFRVRIADVAAPTEPGPLRARFNFNTNATLLGRQFRKCGVSFGVDVAWPIAIQSISSPTQMARKEKQPFLITVSNNSLIPYAASPETAAMLVLHFERGLIPQDPRAVGSIGGPWRLEIPLAQIDPGASVTVALDVVCWDQSEFFERTPWKAELHLQGRLIEFATQNVRTCPDWYENFADIPQDIVMFTAGHISVNDYRAWKSMCDMLKLGLWMWDSERYRGIHANADTKEPYGVGSWRAIPPGATIVFPSSPHGAQGMDFADIVDHFKKFPMSSGELSPGNYIDDSGFLFFGAEPARVDELLSWNGENVDIMDWNLKFGGTHLLGGPNEHDMLEKANSLTRKICEKDPQYPYRLMAIEKDVDRESLLKYSYGKLILKRLPFRRFSKFLHAPRDLSIHIGQENFTDLTSMPLSSAYAQCLLLLITVLPIHKKLFSLATTSRPFSFSMDGGLILWIHDLLKLTLYRDLRADLEHNDSEYPHALALQQAVSTVSGCLQHEHTRRAIFYALERLAGKKSIFSSNKQINSVKDAVKHELLKHFPDTEYQQIKKDNEALIKQHKSFKMEQYYHPEVSFLFANHKKKKKK